MEDIIKKIIAIDNKAKEILEVEQNKKRILDETIKSEINSQKLVLDMEIKEKIENKKEELDAKLEEEKQNIDDDINGKIGTIEFRFEEQESNIINSIFEKLKKGE